MEQDQWQDDAPPSAHAGDAYGLPQEVYITIAFFIGIIFFTLGIGSKPETASITMWILLAGYLVLAASDFTGLTWLVAVAMASLHAGAIISYYSHPVILPFVIIERSGEHVSLNIDFVQIVILSEIIRWARKKKLKNAAKGIHEAAGREDAAVV